MHSLTVAVSPSPGPTALAYLLDRAAAARHLGVSPKTILRFVRERRIPVYRVCRKLLFKKSDLEGFADAHAVPAKSRHRYERS